MRIYDIAFYFCGFFLLGVFAYCSGLDYLTVAVSTALLAVLFLFIAVIFSKKKLFWISSLSLIVVFGSLYAGFYDFVQKESFHIIFGKKISFSGVIMDNPERGDSQQFTVKLAEPYSGNILVKLPLYPAFNYGDLVNFEGVVNSPQPQGYADYLAKDRVFGVSASPSADFVSANNASYLKAALFRIKNSVVANFQKVLPQEPAAFLSGVVLGEQAEFSKGLKDAMAKSGTTHIVALSGYNISIITVSVFGALIYFFSRKTTFYFTAVLIVLFTLMTGAQASVVRAAIMGFIVMLAGHIGRAYGMRNLITVAAFIMVVFNPRVLRFDVGFQLSFLALLGIVYLSPAIKKIFNIKDEPGVLGWRENLLTTLSAQLAVIPILVSSFGRLSLFSLLANVLILELIPPTMFLGFLVAILGFFWGAMAQIFAWVAGIFLSAELFLIKLFGSFGSLDAKGQNVFLFTFYYLTIILFIFWASQRGNLELIKSQEKYERIEF